MPCGGGVPSPEATMAEINAFFESGVFSHPKWRLPLWGGGGTVWANGWVGGRDKANDRVGCPPALPAEQAGRRCRRAGTAGRHRAMPAASMHTYTSGHATPLTKHPRPSLCDNKPGYDEKGEEGEEGQQEERALVGVASAQHKRADLGGGGRSEWWWCGGWVGGWVGWVWVGGWVGGGGGGGGVGGKGGGRGGASQ